MHEHRWEARRFHHPISLFPFSNPIPQEAAWVRRAPQSHPVSLLPFIPSQNPHPVSLFPFFISLSASFSRSSDMGTRCIYILVLESEAWDD